MRVFDWPCRSELYLGIVKKCRVDSAVGAIVTAFKEDWWAQVQSLSSDGASLQDERLRLTKLLRLTLSGELQIVDGMDTLTGTLNILRLVVLAKTPAGEYLREALRKDGPGVDVEALLKNISAQIDAELQFAEMPENKGGGGGLAAELARQLGKVAGEGGPDLKSLKQDRIIMVAHLVARVRELLAEATT
eukprot:TRINITY_DN30177_c0_g1_i2.p2 TRINITY_DN30177_c0_g1~~TRINITY_DN30177_c0_g1_i2.p2  ORF type:complete len:190 (+),score=64.60 TRINITY_DN30177_c0_g1_i2:515-1084(+)